ncbi:MAG TPA: ABC transporter permease [Tepidisphaeraceae bacterium]|jgi:peptide/nickel transport system permease protein|nr:ABC transporter permease [Tepidisphaeraceae bacterium]
MSLATPPTPPPTSTPIATPPATGLATAAIDRKKDVARLSQWQLIRINFAKHKLAVWSLNLLVLLYAVAAFSEFVAPSTSQHSDLAHQYCPPQLPRWNWEHGLHAREMRQHLDPVTLRRTYTESPDDVIPLGFFVKGQSYELWGLVNAERHLFGAKPAPDGTPRNVYFMGADRYGRDLLSRIVYGARISLSVGLIGIAFTFVFGMAIGGVSGYIGGRADTVIQRVIEVINALPQLPLWIALGAMMPTDWSPLTGYFAITIALSLLGWTGLARVVRGKILSLREEDYAMAARLLGASHTRILARHLLPGFTSHIIVALSLSVPGMILGETSLSFLGLGLRPPIVSWGVLLQDCMDVQAVRYYPWLLTPVLTIVATVLCFNFVGDGLRDAADPYASR